MDLKPKSNTKIPAKSATELLLGQGRRSLDGMLWWAFPVLKPTPDERATADRTGVLSEWLRWGDYEIKDGIIRGLGAWERCFVGSDDYSERLARIHDEATLKVFCRRFGLLGCGSPDKQKPGDSVNHCLLHAQTIRALRHLIAAVSTVEDGGNQGWNQLATEVADFTKLHVSVAEGMFGPVDCGSYGRSHLRAAHRIVQSLINANTEGARPFLYSVTIHPRTYWQFKPLYQLAYWQCAKILIQRGLKRCLRPGCPKMFPRAGKKQYCGRTCMDADKHERYQRRKVPKGKRK